MDVYVEGARVRLDPSSLLGKGGEAEVFGFGPDLVLKVFKTPDHPDLQGLKADQAAARARLDEHQRKLPAFPRSLPREIAAPLKLATDRRGKTLVGYAMRRVAHAEPLMRLSDPVFRRAYSGDSVLEVFRRLHDTVSALHGQGVVIGDFNDLNVLVTGTAVDVIDADSFQFGPFLSHVFTERFLDPLLMGSQAPVLSRPYAPAADWFAFAALLMQSLLLVGPWGGVHKPKAASSKVPQAQRPLQRVSVLRPDILYPRPARPLASLPDDVLDVLQRVIEKDQRAPFPRRLLDSLSFSRCAGCGLEHARGTCPVCRPHAGITSAPAVITRGTVVARTLFSGDGDGVVVSAQVRGGKLRCVAHRQGAYVDSEGTPLLASPLGPERTFVASGQGWWMRERSSARDLRQGTTLSADAFAANDRRCFWTAGGGLFREGALGPERIGNVVEGQVRFGVGEVFGAGLYRAGNFSTLFTFDCERGGLRENVTALRLTGELVVARIALSATHAWLLFTLRNRGQLQRQVVVVDAGGAVLGQTDVAAEPDWLRALQADPVAVGPLLFVPTDAGVARVELVAQVPTLTREFPDTEPFVDSATPLLFDGRGLIAVGAQRVLKLEMQ